MTLKELLEIYNGGIKLRILGGECLFKDINPKFVAQYFDYEVSSFYVDAPEEPSCSVGTIVISLEQQKYNTYNADKLLER